MAIYLIVIALILRNEQDSLKECSDRRLARVHNERFRGMYSTRNIDCMTLSKTLLLIYSEIKTINLRAKIKEVQDIYETKIQ